MSKSFLSWFSAYKQRALQLKHRRLVVLAGETSWTWSLLTSIPSFPYGTATETTVNSTESWQIYGDSSSILLPEKVLSEKVLPGKVLPEKSKSDLSISATVTSKNYRHQLGAENQYLVFFASDNDFNIDALAALSGTLVAGGVLFLLWPGSVAQEFGVDFQRNNRQEDDFQSKKSAFLQRFFNGVIDDESVALIEQGQVFELSEPALLPAILPEEKAEPILSFNCKTPEQKEAVDRIIKVVTGHRNRPLVLTADRGRGKSSALAIAAAELLKNARTKMHIVITAPHLQACIIFFQQLKNALPEATFSSNRCVHINGIIEYKPVDVLMQDKPKLNLLLVDEAAGLPVYLLKGLLEQYHRIVFSTTVHGYEGAGRGFTLKFQAILKQQYPQWQKFHMHQPIRWAQHDPLETFIFQSCLLKATLADITTKANLDSNTYSKTVTKVKQGLPQPAINSPEVTSSDFEETPDFSLLTSAQLLADEALLEQVFSVLVTAHYQTKPSDLKMLLDNPLLNVFCLKKQEQVIAVALLMQEGNVAEKEVTEVKNGRRRLRDQFIPQSLLSHSGIEQAFEFSYLRIMRIAVHPQCQQFGIGSYFLTRLEQYAIEEGIDFIGASFGANVQLLSFWLKGDYQLARIGFTPDAASGEHSALVLKALNENSLHLLFDIHRHFYLTFDYLLLDEYQALEVKLAGLILHYCPEHCLPELTAFDLATVQAFADKQRLFSSCVYSLHLWLRHQLTLPLTVGIYPLIHRVLYKNSAASVGKTYQFTGKKALNQHLLNFVQESLTEK